MEITDILDIDGWAVGSGAMASLLSLPSLKTPDSVDWGEQDGKQYDTIGMSLASKEVAVRYTRMVSPGEVSPLEEALRSSYALKGVRVGGLSDWNGGAPKPLTLDLRVKSVAKTQNGSLCALSVSYSMDEPLQGSTLAILPSDAFVSGWTMDGRDFGRWGLVSLEGALTSYNTDGAMKDPQNFSISTADGETWDTEATPRRGESSHTLTMLFRQPAAKAWSLLNGLSSALKADGMRVIRDPSGNTRECVFVSGTASEAVVDGGEAWAKLLLTFNS